jgi:hypothetical protein
MVSPDFPRFPDFQRYGVPRFPDFHNVNDKREGKITIFGDTYGASDGK